MSGHLSTEELEALEEAYRQSTPGEWYTVEQPWRSNYYDRDYGAYLTVPTYAVAGSPDPHAGKAVLDSVDLDEWEDYRDHESQVSQCDADLSCAVAARNALPRLTAEIRRLRNETRAAAGN